MVAGAVIVPLLCWWVVRAEILHHSADLAAMSLPVAAFCLLLATMALRPALRLVGLRPSRRAALLVYLMAVTTVGLASLGFAESLAIQMPALFWRATPENRWADLQALIPTWAAPRDPRALRAFYLGGPVDAATVGPWLLPLAAWTAMLLALCGAMLAGAWLLRERFVRQERLAFPLAVTAVEVAGLGAEPVTRSRLFWYGFAAALGVQALNAVHFQFPAVPGLRVLPRDLAYLLPSAPWNAVGSFWIALYPLAIGLGFLLPLDTGLSCWVWHLLVKAEYVASAEVGTLGLGWPMQGEQAQGAMLALAVLALWPRASGWLREARMTPAAWALGVCAAALVLFSVALGMSAATAAAFLGLYMLGMVAVTRLRAQVGAMWNPGTDVSWLLMAPAGQGRLARGDLAGLAALRWFSYGDCRGAPLPSQLEALKVAEMTGLPPRQVVTALALALAVAVPASLLAVLHTYLANGADTAAVDLWRTGRGDLPWALLTAWLAAPQRRRASSLVAIGLGAALLGAQAVANARLSWWPLSPAGFAMAVSGSLEWLWFPILLAWAAKASVLRWGGMRTYRRSVGFFVGLIAGDYTAAGLLAVGAAWRPGGLYRPFPI
jgi:hypothetical protein